MDYLQKNKSDATFQASRCIETICRPGTITKPNTLASVCSVDRNSVLEPRITLASRSVQRNAPLKILPSVISIRRCRFSHPLNFCFAGDSSGIVACCNYTNKSVKIFFHKHSMNGIFLKKTIILYIISYL